MAMPSHDRLGLTMINARRQSFQLRDSQIQKKKTKGQVLLGQCLGGGGVKEKPQQRTKQWEHGTQKNPFNSRKSAPPGNPRRPQGGVSEGLRRGLDVSERRIEISSETACATCPWMLKGSLGRRR